MLLRLIVVCGVLLVGGRVVADSVTSFKDAAAKSAGAPDFCQADKEGRFYNGGRKFCGPVAMSNSLMWLAQNGYPRLIDGKEPEKGTQIELIRILGSPAYMGTEGRDGTGAQRLMRGAEKYVAERGQRFAAFEYRGWSTVPKQQKPTDDRPTLEWVAEALASPRGGACVNVGWYTHDAAADTYTRRGGHWMTATAAGADGDRPTIDLHDPASRSGKGKVTHHARLKRLTSGTLTGDRKGLPTTAAGLFVIGDGIVPKVVLKGEKTWPIIDGVVVMVME
jgi:hypothetical protein